MSQNLQWEIISANKANLTFLQIQNHPLDVEYLKMENLFVSHKRFLTESLSLFVEKKMWNEFSQKPRTGTC